MCHSATVRRALRALTVVLGVVWAASAQTAAWRRVGSSAMELMLASPATGPVDRAWYSPDGSRLFARTHSGRVFETVDYEVWVPSAAVDYPDPPAPAVARLPESGARVVPSGFGRVYALGRQLFRSDDGGRTWANLTAFKDQSVIGVGQTSVAASPINPDQIVVANRFGVWRSMDGGLSWAGLNQFLPNLTVRRILSTPAGASGTRVEIEGIGPAELPSGTNVWTPSPDPSRDAETAALKSYAALVRADVRSMAISGSSVYLGTADGRILLSTDGGANFIATSAQATGPVERIWADPTRPVVALAAIGGSAAATFCAPSTAASSGTPWIPARCPTPRRTALPVNARAARFMSPPIAASIGRERIWTARRCSPPIGSGSPIRFPRFPPPMCGWMRRAFNCTRRWMAMAYSPRWRPIARAICES